jgi:hypothetical protein
MDALKASNRTTKKVEGVVGMAYRQCVGCTIDASISEGVISTVMMQLL